MTKSKCSKNDEDMSEGHRTYTTYTEKRVKIVNLICFYHNKEKKGHGNQLRRSFQWLHFGQFEHQNK